jgi:hypothetical protein
MKVCYDGKWDESSLPVKVATYISSVVTTSTLPVDVLVM